MLLAALALLLGACGGQSRHVDWRGLELTIPPGWVVAEQRDTLLTVADAPLGDEPGDAGERDVAVQLTHRPGQSVADVHRFLEGQDGDLEVDEPTTVGGRPARRLVYTFDANGTPTREMVVLIPARQLEILLQPIPRPGRTDAPQVFREHRQEFDQLLGSIEFGAPVG